MASWTGKVVGGLLGLFAGGPVGAALGVLLGHQYDAGSGDSAAGPRLSAAQIGEHFFRATFRVMGHVAKSDGRVSEQEIQAARSVMAELRLSPEQVREAIACFTDGKTPQFHLDAALDELRRVCHGYPQLVRVFLEIQLRAALAGNDLSGSARPLLQRVAGRLGVSGLELAHMEEVLRIRAGSFRAGGAGAGAGAGSAGMRPGDDRTLVAAYRVLEVEVSASNDEVTKAYRRQLSRHHPDKLKANGLPESMIEHAKQRTQQIIEAWELIKDKRGI